MKCEFSLLCPRSSCLECFRTGEISLEGRLLQCWICFYSSVPNVAVIANDLCIICLVSVREIGDNSSGEILEIM